MANWIIEHNFDYEEPFWSGNYTEADYHDIVGRADWFYVYEKIHFFLKYEIKENIDSLFAIFPNGQEAALLKEAAEYYTDELIEISLSRCGYDAESFEEAYENGEML